MTGRVRWVLGGRSELDRLWRAYGVQPRGPDAEHFPSTMLLDAQDRQRVGFMTDVLTSGVLARYIALLEREAGAAGSSNQLI